MAKKILKPPEKPAADVVDLSEWLTVKEGVELREKIGKPLSEQQLRLLAQEGKIQARHIKDTRCLSRNAVLSYSGTRGRPPGNPKIRSSRKKSKTKRESITRILY
jgi:hypothetical protein